jgi:hypothetical protein
VDENGITMKAKDNTDMTPEEKTGEILPCEQPSDCLICENEGPVLLYGYWLCDHCKNVVQAEAHAQKRKIIKQDRVSSRSGSSCGWMEDLSALTIQLEGRASHARRIARAITGDHQRNSGC